MLNAQQWDAYAATWTVLARLFARHPDAETLERVRDPEMLADWPLAGGPRTAEGLALLAESAAKGEDEAVLKDDHFKLVIGAGGAKAVPWESVYRSPDRLLFEEQTMQVRAFYRRFGLQAPDLNRRPDDHISLELEFCATLLSRALDAAERGEDGSEYASAHDEFCREHLLAWAPEFFAAVEEHAQPDFYRGVGILGADALTQLASQIGDPQ